MRLGCKNWQDWPCLCLYLCNTAWIEYTTFPKYTCWICYIYNLTRLCCRNCIFRVLRWKLIAFSKGSSKYFQVPRVDPGSHGGSPTFKDQPWLLSPKEWMKIPKLHLLRFQKTSLPFFWTAFSRDGFSRYIEMNESRDFLEFQGYVFPGVIFSENSRNNQLFPTWIPNLWPEPFPFVPESVCFPKKTCAQVRRDPPFQRIRRQWSFPMFGHPLLLWIYLILGGGNSNSLQFLPRSLGKFFNWTVAYFFKRGWWKTTKSYIEITCFGQ